MREYIKIAWRNIWRNKRRTIITVAAVFVAVLLSTFMTSMQEGTYSKMIDNVVKFYSGYIQIQNPEYWESKSINDIFEPDDQLRNSIASVPEVTYYVPRLESFTLISSGDYTKVGALIGIDPEKENKLTGLSKWVAQGDYLKPDDDGILIAVNLAKHLNIHLGDTAILISQGYHGASAAGLYPVKGILKFPSPELNNFGVYLSINKARDFFSAPDMTTSIALMVDNYNHVDKAKHLLVGKLGNKYKVMTWSEMQPQLVQMIEGDRAGGIVMKAILYIVIAFGIFGTVIMMVSERKRESGIMIAVGMRKVRLSIILFFETLLLGFIGVISGFALSLPFISYLVRNPIPLPEKLAEAYEKFGIEPAMYFSMMSKVFVNQAITVLIITIIISFYPVIKTFNLNPVNAIRG